MILVCYWQWEDMGITDGTGNITSLNLAAGMEMRMNSWEREGLGLEKETFPLICTVQVFVAVHGSNIFTHFESLMAIIVLYVCYFVRQRCKAYSYFQHLDLRLTC